MFPKQNVSSVRTARFRARDLGESLADPEPTLRAANHLNQGSWNNEGMDSAKRNPFRLEQEMQPGLMGLENFPKRSAFFTHEGCAPKVIGSPSKGICSSSDGFTRPNKSAICCFSFSDIRFRKIASIPSPACSLR